MKYTLFDRFKNFSLLHRKMMVLLFSSLILTLFLGSFGYAFSKKVEISEHSFDEIKMLKQNIEFKDAGIKNTLKVREVKKTVKGIDVSTWQGKIDWAKLKETGIDFVMIRVGLRKINNNEMAEDERFKYNISQANYYNIPAGVYFYSTAKNEYEVLEEASFTLNLIKDYKITYPVAYDLEALGKGRLENISTDVINYDALVFLDYLKAHGYEGMLYGNKSYFDTKWDKARFANYKIWYAHYTDEITTDIADMWQYTSDGRMSGIVGRVDLNEAYFAYEEVIE